MAREGSDSTGQRVTADQTQEGVVGSTGRSNRVVVSRERSFFLRIPRQVLGEHGYLVLEGGGPSVTLRPEDAVAQPHDRLLFRLPIHKGSRYSLWIQGPEGRRPYFLAGNFDAAIDTAVADPQKIASAGKDVTFPGPPRAPSRRSPHHGKCRITESSPCPECGFVEEEPA